MNATLLLRVASVLALIQFGAHSALFLRATPRHGPDEVAVIEAMKNHQFDFMGNMRSYWDFYFGYGLEAAVICLVEAVLFWQLATIARTSPAEVRPIVALFFAFNVGHAALMMRYFFLTPMVPDVLIAICLAAAFVAAGRQ